MDLKKLIGSPYFEANIDPKYYMEAEQILISRSTFLKMDVYELFESLGRNARQMSILMDAQMDTEEMLENLADSETFLRKKKEFLIDLAFLIKFLMPTMEQFDTSIDKNIEVKSG